MKSAARVHREATELRSELGMRGRGRTSRRTSRRIEEREEKVKEMGEKVRESKGGRTIVKVTLYRFSKNLPLSTPFVS